MAYPRGGMAVKDLSFRVAKGEFVFLTGHSGAGKSTILKLISADLRPTHGELRVSGFSIGELTAREVPKLRRRLGIVFQDFRLLAGPHRRGERGVRARGDRRAARHDPDAGAPGPHAGGAGLAGPRLPDANSPAASSSGWASRARW